MRGRENRLTQMQEFSAGNMKAMTTRSYRYDGEDILLEYDGSKVLQARYTHSHGIDEPIAVTTAGSTVYYHQVGLGTVTELTDTNIKSRGGIYPGCKRSPVGLCDALDEG